MTVLALPTDHVLRTADASVIDFPFDLTHSGHSAGDPVGWVSSWYPRPGEHGQLDRVVWAPSHPRGHTIPFHTASGDVIEFGLGRLTTGDERVIDPSTIVRWFGWLNYGTDRALVVKGPYPSLQAAAEQAAVVVDLIRLDQIDPSRAFDTRRIDPTNS